jgi:hypothetical protein
VLVVSRPFASIEREVQRGRCIYAEPCGHRPGAGGDEAAPEAGTWREEMRGGWL